MSGEDLQLEDIVLLQLFKDQIMNSSQDQAKGGHIMLLQVFIYVPLASTQRFSGHQTDLSELEKALSDPKPSSPPSPSKPAWPDYRPLARLAMASGHLPPGGAAHLPGRSDQYCLLQMQEYMSWRTALNLTPDCQEIWQHPGGRERVRKWIDYDEVFIVKLWLI